MPSRRTPADPNEEPGVVAGLHPPEAGSGRVPIGDYRMTGTLKTLAALGVLLARCSNMALSFRHWRRTDERQFPHPGIRGAKKLANNPMDHDVRTRLGNLRRAPRCEARTRAGPPCKCPAMRGRRRCRLHGGLNPGAPRGARNGNFTDGTWSAEAIEERRWLRSLVRSFGKPENAP
jgi:hypothetical protein